MELAYEYLLLYSCSTGTVLPRSSGTVVQSYVNTEVYEYLDTCTTRRSRTSARIVYSVWVGGFGTTRLYVRSLIIRYSSSHCCWLLGAGQRSLAAQHAVHGAAVVSGLVTQHHRQWRVRRVQLARSQRHAQVAGSHRSVAGVVR